MSFKLDLRLENDSVLLARLGTNLKCMNQLRLSKDSRYPWLILVPEIDHAVELHELSSTQQYDILQISNIVSLLLSNCFAPDKLNIACLGNIVRQLHIHHVARFESDKAWSGPIWGQGTANLYNSDDLGKRILLLKKGLVELEKNQNFETLHGKVEFIYTI